MKNYCCHPTHHKKRLPYTPKVKVFFRVTPTLSLSLYLTFSSSFWPLWWSSEVNVIQMNVPPIMISLTFSSHSRRLTHFHPLVSLICTHQKVKKRVDSAWVKKKEKLPSLNSHTIYIAQQKYIHIYISNNNFVCAFFSNVHSYFSMRVQWEKMA